MGGTGKDAPSYIDERLIRRKLIVLSALIPPTHGSRHVFLHMFYIILRKIRYFITAVPYIFEIVIFVLLFELALIVFLNYPFPVFPFR